MTKGSDIRTYVDGLQPGIFEKNKEIIAQFRFVLTQVCNEQCFFCHNEGLPVERNFMDFNFFSNVIDSIKKEGYPQKIRFTGGEPMLHKGLFKFINYAKDQLPVSNIGMTTNGLLIRKHIEKILSSGLDSLTVSVHSMIPERYEAITKVNGLAAVLSGLAMLRNRGFEGKVKINSVVDEKNIDEMPFFQQFSQQHGFELKIMDVLTHEYKDFSEHHGDHITISEMRDRLGNDVVGHVKEDRTQPKCNGCEYRDVCGHEAAYLRITPGGVINPCLSMKEFNIPLYELEKGTQFTKGVSLGLRRVRNLDW